MTKKNVQKFPKGKGLKKKALDRILGNAPGKKIGYRFFLKYDVYRGGKGG